jgi:outer membrane receptor for ferrienterochelin and colicin
MKIRMIACAAMAFARAYAQETPPVVQVKASADTQRREDTASRIVVNREELAKYGDTSVLDALKRVPGVSVADGVPRMRGLGAGYTQILVNGERPPAGFALENLAPDMVEKDRSAARRRRRVQHARHRRDDQCGAAQACLEA